MGWSYSHFIGHSYTSCLNCHYNPLGGGPINDYGRVVGATAIASGALYPESVTEEQVSHMSGFLFRKPKQQWFRTQLSYRGFQIVRSPGSTKAETKTWLNMQADARLILKFGENDKYLAVANYGNSPLPVPPKPGQDKEWKSREYYLGYRYSPALGVYAGLMDKAYGLRVIEHISSSRTQPQVAQDDQVHGVMGHVTAGKWEGAGHAFVGNLDYEPELRMKGGSFTFERTIAEIHRLGASFQQARNDQTELQAYAGHARLNLKDGSALLMELGQTKQTPTNGTPERNARYGLLQTYLRPMRGLYFLTNIDYLRQNLDLEAYSVRWGPGVQYFPIQKLELRFDVFNSRSFDPKTSTGDSWMYLLQTHVWL